MAGAGVACGETPIADSKTRLDASDYDQSCLDITHCILVDLEACTYCNCPDAAISDEAFEAYVADRNALQETYCPETDKEVCPSCPLREPRCFNKQCEIN
ncbi:MAG: hypothetical protein CMH56_08920 [Myxococcales bacterium]|nr:hypothetical protein [Myxococcales bacterium]